MIELSDLRREPTEEEKAKCAEEARRTEMIAKGLHPDTGRRLRPRDGKTLRSAIERVRFDAWLLAECATDCASLLLYLRRGGR